MAAASVNRGLISLFGSYETGFHQHGSDADISLYWKNLGLYHVGIPTYEERCRKRLNAFAQAAANEGMEGVKTIDARYPVVQFTDPATGVLVDVSVGNFGGVENTKILKRICDIHPVIPIYIYAVKLWAKERDVVNPEKSCINSFTITLMGIMLLQELGVVPIFDKCTGECGELTDADAARTIAGFRLPAIYSTISATDDEKLGECAEFLFKCFAQYYSSFDFAAGAVSLIMPRRLRSHYIHSVDQYMEHLKKKKKHTWHQFHLENKMQDTGKDSWLQVMDGELSQRVATPDIPIICEDPVNYQNCGRRVNISRMDFIRERLTELKQLLETPTVNPAEVFKKSPSPFTRNVDPNRTKTRQFYPK